MSNIPVLRVKDMNGNVIAIPAIQGPKGNPGKDGKDAPSLYEIGKMIYPVGSVYISVAATDPTEIFGGVWQRIKDRFLLAGGDRFAAGSDGGEAEHTLTAEEMPSHIHEETAYVYGYDDWPEKSFNSYVVAHDYTAGDYLAPNITKTMASVHSGYTNNTGGGLPHNNMPPYLAVYMWVRVG